MIKKLRHKDSIIISEIQDYRFFQLRITLFGLGFGLVYGLSVFTAWHVPIIPQVFHTEAANHNLLIL
jgi:hypothetical protein